MAEKWVSLPELCLHLGDDKAKVLCRTRGGVPVYVPLTADVQHELARLVGLRGMLALCNEFGGTWITVPNGRKLEPRKGDVVAMLEAGKPHSAIALELEVTERYVRMVAASMPRMKQLTLPL